MARHRKRRLAPVDALRLVNSRVGDHQRSVDDVLVRIVFADQRPDRVEYASPGRAEYMLTRYSKERFVASPAPYAYVERIGTYAEVSRAQNEVVNQREKR